MTFCLSNIRHGRHSLIHMKILLLFLIPGALFIFAGCSEKGPHLNDTLDYVAELTPNSAPVAAQTNASGVAALEYTKSTGSLSFNLSLKAIEPVRVVIAYGDPHTWDTGPEIVDLTSQVSAGGGTGAIILTSQLERGKLLNNYCYFRVDTNDYPYGELRGQIQLVKEN